MNSEEAATIIQAIMDKRGKYFSRELEAAVLAWSALFKDGGYKLGKKSAKEQVKAWIKSYNKEFSNNTIEHIACVVNPNKKGGTPRSNS